MCVNVFVWIWVGDSLYPDLAWAKIWGSRFTSTTMLKTDFSLTYHNANPCYTMSENGFSTFEKKSVGLF